MRFYYRLINIMLLVLMALAIIAFSTWKLAPRKLHRIGEARITDYIERGKSKTEQALNRLSSGDPSYAEALLQDWEPIRTGDRYYPSKRIIMLALSEHLVLAKEYEKSAALILPFVQENDRDVVMLIEWAKSALHVPELEQMAANELEVMLRRFPDHDGLNSLYIKKVLYKDDDAGASAALAALSGLTPKLGGWSVLYSVNSTTKYEKRIWSKLKPDGSRWALDIPALANAVTLRVDLPPNVRMDVSTVHFVLGEHSYEYAITEMIETHMLEIEGEILSAIGFENPYFVIKTPEWLSEISAEVNPVAKVVFSITNVGLDNVEGE